MLRYVCRMETLKKHLPVSVPEGLSELQKIAVRFEEKIYTAATNQVYFFSLCGQGNELRYQNRVGQY